MLATKNFAHHIFCKVSDGFARHIIGLEERNFVAPISAPNAVLAMSYFRYGK